MNIYLILSIILSILICVKAFILNFQNKLTGKTKENFGEGKPYIQYMQIFANPKIDIVIKGDDYTGEKDKDVGGRRRKTRKTRRAKRTKRRKTRGGKRSKKTRRR